MAHARKQIRAAVVTALTGLASTGARVFASRVYPLDAATQVPGLTVYTPDDSHLVDLDADAGDGKEFRELTVMIEGHCKAVDTFDDDSDQIELEVVTALAGGAHVALAGLGIKTFEWLRSVKELSAEGNKPVARIRMQFRTWYRIASSAPGTIIP